MERDVVSWSSMVDGYCKGERIGDARICLISCQRGIYSYLLEGNA